MAKTVDEILNSLFGESESITKADAKKTLESSGMKLADLSDGDFVTKQKFDDHETKYKKLQKDYESLKNNSEPDEVTKKKIADIEKERDEYKTQFEEQKGKVERSERLATLKKHKFKDEFSDFVLSEVGKNVTDTVDFETAAKKYASEHKQYLEASDDEPGRQSSSLKLSGSKQVSNGIFDSIEDFIRE